MFSCSLCNLQKEKKELLFYKESLCVRPEALSQVSYMEPHTASSALLPISQRWQMLFRSTVSLEGLPGEGQFTEDISIAPADSTAGINGADKEL